MWREVLEGGGGGWCQVCGRGTWAEQLDIAPVSPPDASSQVLWMLGFGGEFCDVCGREREREDEGLEREGG